MRFYLDLPLVVGYVLMATTTCLGMLQLAAARGGYSGLSLFTAERKLGARIGISLTIGALLAYVLFAPDILTPGPAGTEVAEMFVLCALLALTITLLGADRRIQRRHEADQFVGLGETLQVGAMSANLHRPDTSSPTSLPAVIVLPDPTGFVSAPNELVKALHEQGIAVLALDGQVVAKSDAPLSRRTLLGHLSTALATLAQQPGIDAKRTALLGLGLSGDAVLHAAASDRQVRAALAVLPVGGVASRPGSGLHWLRELGYRQIWRWRRRWTTFQRAAADLQATEAQNAVPDSTAVLQPSDGILTMQESLPGVETLTIRSRRHFTLLEDERATRRIAAWFQDKLKHHETSDTNHESRITNDVP